MGEAPVRRGVPVAGELTGGVHAVRLRQLAAAAERKRARRAVFAADAIDRAVGRGGHVDEQSRRLQPDLQKVRMRLEYLHVLRIAHVAEDSVAWRPARPLRMELREPHHLVARPPPARRRAEAVMRSPRPRVRRRPERIGGRMSGSVRHARTQHVAPEGPRRAKARISPLRRRGRDRLPCARSRNPASLGLRLLHDQRKTAAGGGIDGKHVARFHAPCRNGDFAQSLRKGGIGVHEDAHVEVAFSDEVERD